MTTVTRDDQQAPEQDEFLSISVADVWSFVRKPLFLLGVLLLASTATRLIWLGEPERPVADESYYVSAARHIAGFQEPKGGLHYGQGSPGIDPNAEHPPLAKVFIAASLKAFGDTPANARLPAVLFGTLGVAAMYWLARSAGAGQWIALGSATLMAADQLFLTYGRYATLDIFVTVFMMTAVGLYLRKRPVLAGVFVGVAACTKLVGLSALVIIGVIELLRWSAARRSEPAPPPLIGREVLTRWCACFLTACIAYLSVLWALDQSVTTFPDPITHTRYILDYAQSATFQAEAQLTGTGQTLAPVSRPWEWLVGEGSFPVHRRTAAAGDAGGGRVLADFRAEVSPFLIWLVIPALAIAGYRAWADGDDGANLVVAWCATTLLMFVALALHERISYIYYMVVVMPGIYLGVAQLFSRRLMPRPVTLIYVGFVVASFVATFPFRTMGARG